MTLQACKIMIIWSLNKILVPRSIYIKRSVGSAPSEISFGHSWYRDTRFRFKSTKFRENIWFFNTIWACSTGIWILRSIWMEHVIDMPMSFWKQYRTSTSELWSWRYISWKSRLAEFWKNRNLSWILVPFPPHLVPFPPHLVPFPPHNRYLDLPTRWVVWNHFEGCEGCSSESFSEASRVKWKN